MVMERIAHVVMPSSAALVEAMQKAGMDAEKLAAASGVSVEIIHSALENLGELRIHEFFKIAAALKVRPEQLVCSF